MLSSFAFPDPPSKSGKLSKKKTKEDEPTMQSLIDLVGRLNVQVEKLEHITTEQQQQQQQQPDQELSNIPQNEDSSPIDGDHILVDPLALEVPQLYEELLLREPLIFAQEKQEHHHCCCCPASSIVQTKGAGYVAAATGIPWPTPYQGREADEDPLHTAYTHWCTLMRCLPKMDPSAQTYIRTIGLFAMRQLLQTMQARCPSTATLASLQQKSLKYALAATSTSPKGSTIHSGASSSLLAPASSASLLKTSSSCINLYVQTDTTSRKKADAWIPHQQAVEELPPPPPLQSQSQHQRPSPSSQTSTKLKRWFKRHHRVSPQAI